MSQKVFSEDELGRKWDRCFTDGILKLGGGALLGTVFTLLFFKRRKWPVLVGMGFGVGMAYSNCEHEMNTAIQTSGSQCEPKKR